MTDAATNVPDEIHYDAEDVNRANSKPVLRLTGPNEYIKFVVTGPAQKKVGDNGNYQLSLTCAPVDDDGNAKFPTIRNNLFPPVRNKDHEGHKAPNTSGLCMTYLLATGTKGITRFAKWSSDAQGWVKPDGAVITSKTEAEEFNRKATEAVIAAMVDRWKDPSLFERDTFFAQVKMDKTGKYRNIDGITGELPGDATLITDGFGVVE
jgi:hypothetical protein